MKVRIEYLIALLVIIIVLCTNCAAYAPTEPVDFEYMERKVERWHQQQERAYWSRHLEEHRRNK